MESDHLGLQGRSSRKYHYIQWLSRINARYTAGACYQEAFGESPSVSLRRERHGSAKLAESSLRNAPVGG